ncbi:hypothetical protein ACLI08_04525 [Flavobacterium sp. RNTU_13]|uniref:hypothetical protein n=1 Tax=Flavobacterium sp. RNTU_13 TaxID=3375145 RepID=UPI00398710D6
MRKLLLTLFMLFNIIEVFSQTPITEANIKYNTQQYILFGKPKIFKVDKGGNRIGDHPMVFADLNMTFIIMNTFKHTGDTIYCQIKIDKYPKKNLAKRMLYNFYSTDLNKLNSNEVLKSTKDTLEKYSKEKEDVYYIIKLDDILKYGYIYNPFTHWEFNFGTITYLTRIRPAIDGQKSRWSNDLSLGIAAGTKYNFSNNFSISLLGGLSISKVSLDELSTKGVATQVVEKPALTPNINLIGSYKFFSLGIGLGWDIVNNDTVESKAWIYNGKPFMGLCFGINIFQPHEEDSKQVSAQDN